MRLADGVHLFRDTCDVHVLVRDRHAVLTDFGDGADEVTVAPVLPDGRHAEAEVDVP